MFYLIDSHNCTEEELGLTGDYSKFKPIREKSKRVFEGLTFVCPDSNHMHLHGQIGSRKGRILHAAVVRCTNQTYCKSTEEIDNYLTANSLAMMNN